MLSAGNLGEKEHMRSGFAQAIAINPNIFFQRATQSAVSIHIETLLPAHGILVLEQILQGLPYLQMRNRSALMKE